MDGADLKIYVYAPPVKGPPVRGGGYLLLLDPWSWSC